MYRAGVPLIAGTDCLNPFCLPGFSLHTELQLLVDAGLPPVDALRAATINAARFQGRESGMGSIEAGKVADLVLLNADPLDDIANTRDIECVIIRGRLIARKEIDQKLRELIVE
jgi:imidazolonepropionase-like amidohydrolase